MTIWLVRHARSKANVAGVLAGRTPGVGLDDSGLTQAGRIGERLADVPFHRIAVSPMMRCQQTAQLIVTGNKHCSAEVLHTDEAFTECNYGLWSNRLVAELETEPLWAVVKNTPTQVTFPRGESIVAMSERATTGLRRLVGDLSTKTTPGIHLGVVTHGDIVKAIVAHVLGLPLDQFQRLAINTGSVSVLRVDDGRWQLVRYNDTGPFVVGDGPPQGTTVGGSPR